MAKRRLISLLPSYQQTDDLTNFFGSTVDEVFQPGTSEPLSGYIGHRAGADPQDFYVPEPDGSRSAYQLEPGMVSYNTPGAAPGAVLSYPDFIGYLETNGADVSDHQRLTETEYYTYAPPISIDALINYHQYYWFGDINGSADLPILDLTIPVNHLLADGATLTFAMPLSINAIPIEDEAPSVIVNGVAIDPTLLEVDLSVSYQYPYGSITITDAAFTPPSGADVIVTRVANFAQAITSPSPTTGQITSAVNVADINSHGVQWLSSGMRIRIIDAQLLLGGWDAIDNDISIPWDARPVTNWKPIAGISGGGYAGALFDGATSGLPDDGGFPWDYGDGVNNGIFMVDGIGLSVRLTPDAMMERGIKAQYVTVDRSSIDRNEWSLHNMWVHRDTFAWATDASFITPLSQRQATRPIIEFIRDLELWHIDVTLTVTAQADYWDIHEWDAYSWDAGDLTFALDAPLPNVVGRQVFGYNIPDDTFVTEATDTLLSMTKIPLGDIPAGTTISIRQGWQESIDPLFMLYDLNNMSLDDLDRYPGSTFLGSTIFDYTLGSGKADPILLRPLSFDDNGYFIFDNKTVTERYSYNNGTISGMYAYATNDGVTKIIEPLWHAVRGTTTQGTTNGYFDVPLNLHANPLSDDVSTISRSTWTAHFTSIIANQPELVGQPNAANNYRDTSRDLTLGTQILQHRAPLLKAMLLAANSSFDLPQSIRYAEQEYNRFRNKFSRKLVDLYHRGTLRDSDPTNTWVTTALQEIKRDKTAQFPFAFNTVAGGNYFIPPTPTCLGILPAAVPAMVIDTSYLTPVLMILGHDGSLTPAFSTLFTLVADATSSTTTLAVGNTKGVGIGRTVSTTSVIGRIVSITDSTITIDTPLAATLSQGTIITVNDWRDPIMLALEQTIYSNLPSQFRTEARPGFDIQQWIGSRFFNPFNGYSRDEVTQMLMPWFELWVQQNQFDYRTHIGFSYGDPFTWNYRGVLDRGGMPLPGYWRAIYRYYFGTDVPHLRPWECLGFVSEPTWWRDNYGDPPYARTNTDLWTDLENGTIRDGPRAGTDDTYARNNLADFIPVDSNGNLLDPVAAGIVITTVPYDVAQRPWMLGDGSPVESLWTISPSYRYALAMAAFLMKPARFVEECWNVLTIGYHSNQWIDFTTLDRPLNSQQYVHGEMVNDAPLQVFGVSQWIADYMLSSGHTSDALGEAVRGLTVRLIHQMAGFTSNDDMKVVADNFGLLPSEDVNIVLYNSPSSGTEVYSGVILEWTGRGWRAIGYDARDPFFTIIPPDTNGPKGLISIATTAEPTIVKWRPNTYYPVGIFVEWLNTVWVCLRSHTSSPQFEQGYWQSKPDMNAHMIRAPRVITYLRGLDTTQRIPYGTVFYDYQSIGDFLLGWQRWLESRGWIFDDTDPQTGELRNWSLSVKEFLTWAQVQWAPGNFIALSPGQHQLKFTAASGTILNVESNTTGFFGLVDRSGRPINQRDALISRLDGDIKIRANNADVFGARLNLANIEHALVFSNITIFQDVCYLPLFDIRQSRLRLICKRSRDWAGRLDAPGFVIIGSQLKSDFEKAVEDVRTMFDIETPDRADLRDYARHVIGFQRRDYLENLLLSDVEQLEFYQGMVQQKGAPGVFEKLARSNRAANDSDLQFLEEWAVRIDEFGAPVDPFFIFQLSRTDMRNDPQIVRMIPTNNAPPNWIVLTPNDPRWLDRPNDPGNFFIMHPARPALPSAGPVRVSDATYTCFTLADVPSLYLSSNVTGVVPFAANSLTWVYERNDSSFTVLQSFETGAVPNALLVVVVSTDSATDSTEPPADSSTTRLYFQHPHTLTTLDVGNYLVVDGLSMAVPEMQGLVPIKAVTDDYVDLAFGATSGFDFTDQESTAPFCRVLREVRFPSIGAGWDPLAAVSASGSAGALFSGAASTPSTQPIQLNNAPYDFVAGNLAWIDIDHDPSWPQNQFGWTVRQYDGTTWNVVRSQPLRPDPRTISETVIFRSGTRVADQQLIINEPVVDDLVVIDPMAGLIAGLADREIDFKLENDPARYNDASGIAAANPWGANEVGRVWWNLSTVRFLDPLTDSLGMSDARDIAELKYRIANWTRIAPGSSIDVYEWIESTVDPAHYSGPGTIFGIQTPAQPAAGNDATTTARWVERTMYDETLQRDVTKFYYWVKGLTTTPNVPFRHTDISTVAMAITNPAAAGLAWMGAIDRNALIVSGIAQYLDDGSTVMKVRLTLNPDNAGRHDEWQLLRPTDETSLPSTQIWNKMRDSLAGFDAFGTPLPDHTLPPSRTVGIRQGQSMFVVDGPDGTRSGLLAARQSFVGIINQIFARLPMQRDRGLTIPTLYRSTLRANDSGVIDQHLAWTQLDGSYGIEPPPRNEWDVRVFALDARNRLLGRDDFLAAAENGTNLRVLLDGTAHPVKQWSIWEFDAKTAKLMLEADESLIANADTLYSLATAYEVVVADRTARNALTDLDIGTRVFVTNDVSNFWVIWKFLPADPNADAFGFILWRMQRYRTDDFISVVDWYSPGYSASNPPIITYDTIGARTTVEGIQPISQFVKINDDGSSEHRWIWTKYNPGSSYVVVNDALQGATILTLDHTDQIVVGQPLALANSTAVVFSTNTVVTAITATTISLNLPLVGKIQAGNQINIGGYWSTVAMQNGTIALTDDFYDLTRVPLRTIADITNRDGSWELMVLADALRYGGMLLDSEVNEVFFSILNYVHVSQDDIDWVFKTSFMVIVGYDVPLQQTPVLLADQTDNLIQYCNEVKPYHVKIRGVSTQYNTDLDVGHVHIDTNYAFDITLLFDRIDLADTWDVDAWNQYVWDDTAVDEAWDESRWQRYVWDTDIGETGMVQVYIHTIVLDVSDNQLHVADVRFLQDSALITTINPLWVNVGALYTITENQVAGVTSLPLDRTDLIMIGMPVNGPNSIIPSDAFPEDTVVTGIGIGSITLSRPTNLALKAGAVINIGDVYQIVNVEADPLAAQDALSGYVKTGVSGVLTSSDTVIAAPGSLVEAMILMPDAELRIMLYDPAAQTDNADELGDLLGVNVRPIVGNYTVTTMALSGDITILLDNTSGIIVGQPVFAPSIAPDPLPVVLPNTMLGTVVTAVTSSSISLSKPLLRDLAAGSTISVLLPQTIVGPNLYLESPPDLTYQGTGLETDESDVIDVEFNPALSSRPGGFDLRSPYHDVNHPEERLPFNADDALHLSITATPTSGGPQQEVKTFDIAALTEQTILLDLIPQSNDAVMVFLDGLRVRDGYIVDQLARTVTVTLSDNERVLVHTFGVGGTSAVRDSHYHTYGVDTLTTSNAATTSNTIVVVDGIPTTDFTIASAIVTLNTPPANGTNVAIVTFHGAATTATQIHVQTDTSGASSILLDNPDIDTKPEHAGTIVEVNGLRLTPPATFYATLTPAIPWMLLPMDPTTATSVQLYVNDADYGFEIPIWQRIDTGQPPYPANLVPTGDPPLKSGPTGGIFVVVEDWLVCLQSGFTGDVTFVLERSSDEYTVEDGTVTINTSISVGDTVTLTTFSNASTMDTKTMVFDDGWLCDFPLPSTPTAGLVSMNGLYLAPNIDYEILKVTSESERASLQILSSVSGTLVVTVFTGIEAGGFRQWMSNTRVPALVRMPPLLVEDRWDNLDFDDVAFDDTAEPVTEQAGFMRHGPDQTRHALYQLRNEDREASAFLAGRLTETVAPDADTIEIDLFLRDITTKLQPTDPLAVPQGIWPRVTKPGAIWIGGERIEYFGFERTDDHVSLSGLRRTTRGTTMLMQQTTLLSYGELGPDYTIAGTGTVIVTVDGIPVSFTSHTSGGNTIVTVSASADAVINIVLTPDDPFTYPVGMIVRNGDVPFNPDPPPGLRGIAEAVSL